MAKSSLNISDLAKQIDQLYSGISSLDFAKNSDAKNLIFKVITMVDSGELRAAEKTADGWVTHEFVKKAILIYLKCSKSSRIAMNFDSYLSQPYSYIHYMAKGAGARLFAAKDDEYGMKFYDKVPLKFAHFTTEDFESSGVRVVPGTVVRFGSYIAKKCVLMPSFVNIGAHIGEGTMIDTWATVGSCAQIGKNCHISGGAGIGGVLEPVGASPVIIEDNVFIGARSEVAEGVIVEEGSVLGMGVYIGASTKIVNRETGEVFYGRVPKGSVVVPGTIAGKNDVSLYAAIIIKTVDEKTRSKTQINELLRQ